MLGSGRRRYPECTSATATGSRCRRTRELGPRHSTLWAHTMWTPPERIRHPLPETTWPSADEARGAALFSSIRIGPNELRHRTWVPAMVPWRATEEGFVTREVLDWYERFARGQPGAIVVEATGIRDIRSGPLLRIGHDRFVPGLRELVETVRAASEGQTRLFIQIIDFLSVKRRPPAEKFFRRFLEIRAEHREKLSEVLEDPSWKDASESDLRDRLLRCTDDELDKTLTPRELDDLRRGASPRSGVRRCRAALRPCLHDGVVPLEAKSPRRRIRRIA